MGFYSSLKFKSTCCKEPRLPLPTIYSEVHVFLSGKSVISDGDLNFVGALIWQLQVVEQQWAIFEEHDAATVLAPQVPNDVSADRLHHSDGFVPLQLPLDDRPVWAGAGVANREQGRAA